MDDIPPLLPADQMPPIRHERDLHERWRALMGELGFSERVLWVAFVRPDGMMLPHIVQVVDTPTSPDVQDLEGLMGLCSHASQALDDDIGVAVLLSRPGSAVVTASDRAWAAGIACTARTRSIRAFPMHLATDEAVRVLAPDDLIGVA